MAPATTNLGGGGGGDEIGIQKALTLLGGAFQNKINSILFMATNLKQPTLMGVTQVSLLMVGTGCILMGVNFILMDYKLKRA